jgi:hypothetical protein
MGNKNSPVQGKFIYGNGKAMSQTVKDRIIKVLKGSDAFNVFISDYIKSDPVVFEQWLKENSVPEETASIILDIIIPDFSEQTDNKESGSGLDLSGDRVDTTTKRKAKKSGPIKNQLHLFVNMERLPMNRVAVFTTHFQGRLKEKGVRANAMNVTPGGEGFVNIDLPHIDDMTLAPPEDSKNYEARKGESGDKTERLKQKVKSNFKQTYTKAKPVMEGDDKYDEIIIIGVAKPETKKLNKKSALYEKYSEISGIKEIDELAGHLQETVTQKLRKGGHLRLQLCHANTVTLKDSRTFADAVSPEGMETTTSAPESFSIIDDRGNFIDITTHMSVFDKLKQPVRKILAKKNQSAETMLHEIRETLLPFKTAIGIVKYNNKILLESGEDGGSTSGIGITASSSLVPGSMDSSGEFGAEEGLLPFKPKQQPKDFAEAPDGTRYATITDGIRDNGQCLWDTLRLKVPDYILNNAAEECDLTVNEAVYDDKLNELLIAINNNGESVYQLTVHYFDIFSLKFERSASYGEGKELISIGLFYDLKEGLGHYVPPS